MCRSGTLHSSEPWRRAWKERSRLCTGKGSVNWRSAYIIRMLCLINEYISSYELHVEKECRGRGIGRDLVHRLEKIARDEHYPKVMLTVFKGIPSALVACWLSYVTFSKQRGLRILSETGVIAFPDSVSLA
jgi:GNAT superfamily N-acetyltransferase